MSQKRLGQVDLDTGEIIEEGFVAYVAPKRQNWFGTRWFAMSQDMLGEIAQLGLSGNDYSVLMMMLSKLDYENLLVVNQAELAKQLNMARQHFSRSLKKLIDAGIILKGPRIGVSRSYRLNPTYGWKGSASNHKKAVKTHLKLIEGNKKDKTEETDQSYRERLEKELGQQRLEIEESEI